MTDFDKDVNYTKGLFLPRTTVTNHDRQPKSIEQTDTNLLF